MPAAPQRSLGWSQGCISIGVAGARPPLLGHLRGHDDAKSRPRPAQRIGRGHAEVRHVWRLVQRGLAVRDAEDYGTPLPCLIYTCSPYFSELRPGFFAVLAR